MGTNGSRDRHRYLTKLTSQHTFTKGNHSEDSTEVVNHEIESVANQWGFEVVQVEGDGNCFFSAVSFQILQMLMRGDLISETKEHFSSLGISPTMEVTELNAVLRNLLVAEWTGPYMDEYEQYLADDVNFMEEASAFFSSGVFASSIGDIMPLALSNVLQVPIFILSTQTLVPFIEIHPRRFSETSAAIFLTYNHAGPGHYNALVARLERQHDHDGNEQCHTITHGVNDIDDVDRRICRCGINQKSGTAGTKRKYSSRCRCIALFGQCTDKCKCKSSCLDGGECRKPPQTPVKTTRQGRKRKEQPLQTSPFKTSQIFYEERTHRDIDEAANELELLLLSVILKAIEENAMKEIVRGADNSNTAWITFNKIVDFILENDFLCVLPIFKKSVEQIKKCLKKLKNMKP